MRIQASKFRSVMESRGAGESANAAIVADYGDGWLEVDTLHPAYQRAKTGLGDYVANALDAVGITKDRVQAVASAVGIKDCGCKQRQQKLTEFGQKYLGIGVPKKP